MPKKQEDGPSNKHEIQAFMHCSLCVQELTERVERTGKAESPAEYSQIEAGWTKRGFQVWCRRHNVNIVHVDFEGQKHKANTTREA